MYSEKHRGANTGGAEPVSAPGEIEGVVTVPAAGTETQAFVAAATRSYEFVPPQRFPWDLAALFGAIFLTIGAPGVWALWRLGSIVGWW